jgi:hypothetical protein
VITERALRELNRVLSVTMELSLIAADILPESITLACQQSVYFGGFPDHQDVLDTAMEIGFLVRRSNNSLFVSDLGEQFLSLNPERYYELQTAQLPFLFALLISEGPLHGDSTELASLFQEDPVSGSLFLRAEQLKSFPTTLAGCLAVFRQLEVVRSQDDVWVVAPTYLRAIGTLRSASGIGEDRLRLILEEKARFGRAAELLAVEWERARLRAAGAHAQATLVRRISEWNVSAGYDIDSFDDASGYAPDRFIEVKASSSKGLRFFWTRNEYLTARRLGSAYFIYYIAAFQPRLGLTNFSPRIIKDPAATLPTLPTIALEAQLYLVTERAAPLGVLDVEPVDMP